jgi:hypothetical protein
MSDDGLNQNRLPDASHDDIASSSIKQVFTQNFDSLPMLIDDENRDDGLEIAKQILDFDASHSMSAHDPEMDPEVTTQVLDTLDALDMVDHFEQPPMSPKMDTNGEFNEESHLPPSDATSKRLLPEWMTATPPSVVTRRSLFLNTQSRHCKKQIFLEEEEKVDVPSSKYPYIDIMRPSDMNLDRIICFDVESTGFASTDGIIEIGAVEYILGQRTGALFQSYIKPSVPINQHAAEVHGLTNVMLANAPPAHIVIPSFLSWVGNSPLVAHNARFDMRMFVHDCHEDEHI